MRTVLDHQTASTGRHACPHPVHQAEAENRLASQFVSLQGMILGTSPYAYLDDVGFTAFSPSTKASFPSPHGPSIRDVIAMFPTAAAMMPPSAPMSPRLGSSQDREAPDHHAIMKTLASLEGLPPPSVPKSQSAEEAAQMQELAEVLATFKPRLPNPMFRLDLRTLNLHLAIRTIEILSCAEAMWEWVLEFQAAKSKTKEKSQLRGGSADGSSSTLEGGQPVDPIKATIAELTRAEFDGLLTQFNLCVIVFNQYVSAAASLIIINYFGRQRYA